MEENPTDETKKAEVTSIMMLVTTEIIQIPGHPYKAREMKYQEQRLVTINFWHTICTHWKSSF